MAVDGNPRGTDPTWPNTHGCVGGTRDPTSPRHAAVLAFRLDREPLYPLWTLPLQQFPYRQVMYLVLFQSAVAALTDRRMRWQELRRTGDVTVAGAGGA